MPTSKNAGNHRATNDGNEDTVKASMIAVDSRSPHPASRAIPHRAMMPSFEAAVSAGALRSLVVDMVSDHPDPD
jgi:hypothetical protein